MTASVGAKEKAMRTRHPGREDEICKNFFLIKSILFIPISNTTDNIIMRIFL